MFSEFAANCGSPLKIHGLAGTDIGGRKLSPLVTQKFSIVIKQLSLAFDFVSTVYTCICIFANVGRRNT